MGMFGTMMLGGFVGMMALDRLMSRFHWGECSLRRSKAKCARQDGQHHYQE
jgi:hypothetical protein